MDLKKLMQSLHYGAQHLTQEELQFFTPLWNGFQRTSVVPPPQVPVLVEMYKRVTLRQIDVAALVAELQNNVLFLSDDEKAAVDGAVMTLELLEALDLVSIQKLVNIRGALHQRQHRTLVRDDETGKAGQVVPAAPRRALPAGVQPRPSARRGAGSALEAASKLIKR